MDLWLEEKIAGAVAAGSVRVWACYGCGKTKSGGTFAPACDECGKPMEFFTLGEENRRESDGKWPTQIFVEYDPVR
jgi:hypothetical protein